MPHSDTTAWTCQCCGAPATQLTTDGVPLCEGDYAHLVEHWVLDSLVDPPSLDRHHAGVSNAQVPSSPM